MSTAPDAIYRPTFAEIDLDAYARNLAAIRQLLPPGSDVMAVLKADGYGHGAVELARVCEREQVPMLAVALFEEALEIRRGGVALPILTLGALTHDQVKRSLGDNFILGITGPESLRLVHQVATAEGKVIPIHLKLDSGMGRMGLAVDDLDLAAALLGDGRLDLQAIYTHYANASDPSDPFTTFQQQRFDEMRNILMRAGVSAPLHHSANSAATVRRLVAPGDMARVGLSLLGAEPLDAGTTRLEPVLRWATEIVRVKQLAANEAIGYGTTYRTSRPSRIATLPVGYADGYDRLLSNRGEVLIRGRRVPVVGRVSMDLVTVDVTDLPEVASGEPVVLLGRDGIVEISAEEHAEKTGTIPYEVFCRISARVPRVYRGGGAPLRIRSRFACFVSEVP